MTKAFDHGARLSDEEYDRRIVGLQSGLPPVPSKEQRIAVMRAELDLAVDHRLGCDFPQERREVLWAIQRKAGRKRLRLMFKYFLRRAFAQGLVRDAQGLAGYLVGEYAKVLNQAELEAFFGKEEAARPALPVDIEQLKR